MKKKIELKTYKDGNGNSVEIIKILTSKHKNLTYPIVGIVHNENVATYNTDGIFCVGANFGEMLKNNLVLEESEKIKPGFYYNYKEDPVQVIYILENPVNYQVIAILTDSTGIQEVERYTLEGRYILENLHNSRNLNLSTYSPTLKDIKTSKTPKKSIKPSL